MPKCPKVRMCGDDAAMIEVTGNPRNQEPTHVRIVFPGGELELVRAKDGVDADYWCHIRVNHVKDSDVAIGEAERAGVTDGRIDLKHKHANESDAGDLRLEMIKEGSLDRDTVITACMSYMSEADVADMCSSNDFFDIDDDEEENAEDGDEDEDIEDEDEE